MVRRIGKWTQKLNDEHKTFAMVQMACGVASTQVVKQIKEKYDIDISDVRLRNIRDSKTWFPIFKEAQSKYYAAQTKSAAIPIAAKENRLREADKVAKKLYRLINKVETAIDTLTEEGINPDSAKYVLTLVKTLRETAKIYKEFLTYAKDETVDKRKKYQTGSFLTQINVNTDGKAKELEEDIDRTKHLVVETDENRGIQ